MYWLRAPGNDCVLNSARIIRAALFVRILFRHSCLTIALHCPHCISQATCFRSRAALLDL
jgi:hypothetical protein